MTVAAEVQKFLEVGFIRKFQYPEWVSNIISVKKSNGTRRMCVNFANLNKVYSKDGYPFLKIDKLVDSTARHELFSFIDAFLGYHQIPLSKED